MSSHRIVVWLRLSYAVELFRFPQYTVMPVELVGGHSLQLPVGSYHNPSTSRNTSKSFNMPIICNIRSVESYFSVAKAQAVAKIEVWWWKMRNRKIFRILKEAIRAAVSKLQQ